MPGRQVARAAAIVCLLLWRIVEADVFYACPTACRLTLTGGTVEYNVGPNVVCSVTSVKISGASFVTFTGGGLNVTEDVDISGGTTVTLQSPDVWTPLYVNVGGHLSLTGVGTTLRINNLALAVNQTLAITSSAFISAVGTGGPGSTGSTGNGQQFFAPCPPCLKCGGQDAGNSGGIGDGGSHAAEGGYEMPDGEPETYDNDFNTTLHLLQPGCGGGRSRDMESFQWTNGVAGGGAINVFADALDLESSTIDVSALTGPAPAGGGAGGSIQIVVRTIFNLEQSNLMANGGNTDAKGCGGAGGVIVFRTSDATGNIFAVNQGGHAASGCRGTAGPAPQILTSQPYSLPDVLRGGPFVCGNGTIANGTYGALGYGGTRGFNTGSSLTTTSLPLTGEASTTDGTGSSASTTTSGGSSSSPPGGSSVTSTSSTSGAASSTTIASSTGTTAADGTDSTATGSASAPASTTVVVAPLSSQDNSHSGPEVTLMAPMGAIIGGVCAALLIGALGILLLVRRRRAREPGVDEAVTTAHPRAPERTGRGEATVVQRPAPPTPVAPVPAALEPTTRGPLVPATLPPLTPSKEVTTRGSLLTVSEADLPPRGAEHEATTRTTLASTTASTSAAAAAALSEDTSREVPLSAGHWEDTQRTSLIASSGAGESTRASEHTVRASMRGSDAEAEATVRSELLADSEKDAAEEPTIQVSELVDPERTHRVARL